MKNGNNYQGKREAPDGECCVERGVTQKVLEKRGMKRKNIKCKLRSAERGGVKECGMKLRSAARGGVKEQGMQSRSTERGWGRGGRGGGGGYRVQNEMEESQSSQRSTDGIGQYLCQRKSADKGWVRTVECIIGVPVGIEELPSRDEEPGKRVIEYKIE